MLHTKIVAMRVRAGLKSWIEQYRPDTGSMSVLYQQRKSLYWLVVLTGVFGYVGLIAFLGLMVVLLGIGGVQAMGASAGNRIVPAYLWLGYSGLAFVGLISAVYLSAKWAGQYEVRE